MLYTPLLPDAAAGTLEPRHVVMPLREELERTDLRLGRVTGRRPGAQGRARCARSTAASEELPYDQLLLALGSVSRTLPVPGAGRARARLQDARRRDRAAQPRDRDARGGRARPTTRARRALLTYVFVGGGYAGLEGARRAAGLRRRRRSSATRAAASHGLRFILVEARDRVMPRDPAELADFADARAARAAASTSARARRSRRSTPTRPRSPTGEVVPTAPSCWTAGVKPHPGRRASSACRSTSGGRIRSDRLLRVQGARRRLGDRRRRRASPTRPRAGSALPADRPARAAPGPGRRPTTSPPIARRRRRPPVPLPHARRVRRHRPLQGGRRDAGHHAGAASRPGSSPAPTTWR